MQTPQKISVLVAEDNPVNQEIIIAMLQDYGIETELVENGREAVDALEHGPFDLIFMDCQMPGMDGFEATSCIRNSDKDTRNIPIIAMTANVMMQDRTECFAVYGDRAIKGHSGHRSWYCQGQYDQFRPRSLQRQRQSGSGHNQPELTSIFPFQPAPVKTALKRAVLLVLLKLTP